jgi:UPF0755 protein
MLDDLDLAWEEHQEPRRRRGAPPSRQTRQRRRREKKRRRRSFGALFISFILLAALGGGVYWGLGKVQEFFGSPDFEGNPQEVAVNVTVEEGDTATDIGTELFEKKVVKSVKAFVNAASAEPRSKNIQPGTYKLYEQTKASVALSMLLDPETNLIVNGVLIREGLSAIQTYKVLSEATGIPQEDFAEAAKDPLKLGVPDWWFNRQDEKDAKVSIEGFLFPDTYQFAPDAKAADMLKVMVDRFNTVVGDLKFVDTVQQGLSISPFEALIVASLAQTEAGNEADMAKVSRVAYNRLFKDFPCGCLQFDVTANYWLELNGKPTKSSDDLTNAELHDAKNPYNTHDVKGLPVGPISNPGKAALEGAMKPASGSWYYFVAIDKEGRSAFATTLAEHQQNEQLACRNGVLTC